jgi:hypothetical protein
MEIMMPAPHQIEVPAGTELVDGDIVTRWVSISFSGSSPTKRSRRIVPTPWNSTVYFGKSPPFRSRPVPNTINKARFNVSDASVTRARLRAEQAAAQPKPVKIVPVWKAPATTIDFLDDEARYMRVYSEEEKNRLGAHFEMMLMQEPDAHGQTMLTMWDDALTRCGFDDEPWKREAISPTPTHSEVAAALMSLLVVADRLERAGWHCKAKLPFGRAFAAAVIVACAHEEIVDWTCWADMIFGAWTHPYLGQRSRCHRQEVEAAAVVIGLRWFLSPPMETDPPSWWTDPRSDVWWTDWVSVFMWAGHSSRKVGDLFGADHKTMLKRLKTEEDKLQRTFGRFCPSHPPSPTPEFRVYNISVGIWLDLFPNGRTVEPAEPATPPSRTEDYLDYLKPSSGPRRAELRAIAEELSVGIIARDSRKIICQCPHIFGGVSPSRSRTGDLWTRLWNHPWPEICPVGFAENYHKPIWSGMPNAGKDGRAKGHHGHGASPMLPGYPLGTGRDASGSDESAALTVHVHPQAPMHFERALRGQDGRFGDTGSHKAEGEYFHRHYLAGDRHKLKADKAAENEFAYCNRLEDAELLEHIAAADV